MKFDYGNQDVSGDVGKNNGLTHAWLSSSLLISPEEQTIFLQKIINKTLPVSPKSLEFTKKIMFIQEMAGGWKLYGKTGTGRLSNTHQHGWFVGWIEKGDQIITFASHINDDKKHGAHASFRIKNEAIIKLWYLINELEN